MREQVWVLTDIIGINICSQSVSMEEIHMAKFSKGIHDYTGLPQFKHLRKHAHNS